MRKVLVGAALGAFAIGAVPASANIAANPNFDLASPQRQTAPVDWTLVLGDAGNDADAGEFPYTLETLTVTAGSSSTVLAFSRREVPDQFDLDNVSISETSLPEASTWAMLAAGLAGLAFAGRRMRRPPPSIF